MGQDRDFGIFNIRLSSVDLSTIKLCLCPFSTILIWNHFSALNAIRNPILFQTSYPCQGQKLFLADCYKNWRPDCFILKKTLNYTVIIGPNVDDPTTVSLSINVIFKFASKLPTVFTTNFLHELCSSYST